jgi:CSLREA domain-containing protein
VPVFVVLALIAVWVPIGLAASPASADSFTVVSSADSFDDDPGDGLCDPDGNLSESDCTLRAAIEEANDQVGPHTIGFAGPFTGVTALQPATAYPLIEQQVTIHATAASSCAGAPASTVEIDGNGLADFGLRLAADDSKVCGLVIHSFVGTTLVNGGGIQGAAANVQITKNLLGTDPTGALDQGNSVGVFDSGSGTLIAGNLISGNDLAGIYLNAGANVVIKANLIGTDLAGAAAVGNGDGISVTDAKNLLIGGTASTDSNVISGNTGDGIEISDSLVNGAETIQGNRIGTTLNGTGDLGNAAAGIKHTGTEAVTIGGTVAAGQQATSACDGACNVISGNTGDGALILGGANATVAGNYIGLDVSGASGLTQGTGVRLTGASTGNVIGGTSSGARNLISGNSTRGVRIDNSDGVTVSANYIGLGFDGSTAIGNGINEGLQIFNGSETAMIGGTTAGKRNVISGNSPAVASDGIEINGSNNNTVQGNYIGTDKTGQLDRGNGGNGVFVSSSTGNQIGGDAAGEGNVLSGNARAGVSLFGTTTGTTVEGNTIGLAADASTPLGNTQAGVSSAGSPSSNTIGGPGAGQGNTIAANGTDGVELIGGTAKNNVVSGNSIHSNGTAVGDLGIDLGGDGVSTNDAGDPDPGDNDLQNFPQPAAAATDGAQTVVSGSLNSEPDKPDGYRIEFFSSPACDDAGAGEGETYLGSIVSGSTDAGGDVAFFAALPPTTLGDQITATATDLASSGPDGTSEFSACLGVVQAGTIAGTKFEDLNGDAIRGVGEPGLAGWTIYVDSDNDNQRDPGEASDLTDANGAYSFTLAPGNHTIRELQQAGYVCTAPGDGVAPEDDCEHAVALAAAQNVTGKDFGNRVPPTPSAPPSAPPANTPAPKDTRAPVATLSASSKQRLAGGSLVLKLKADEPSTATVSATINVPGASKTYKLKSVKKDLVAGKTLTVKLKISKSLREKVRKALARRRTVKATLKVSVADAAGNTTSKRKTVKAKG